MTLHDGDPVTPQTDSSETPLPRPHITRTRWPFPLIWLVPFLALIALVYYLYSIRQQRGVEIAISLDDASGLKIKDTPLTFHGVRVGSITGIELDADNTHALVRVQLERRYEKTIARDGGRFWVVRPDLGGGMITGLSTVISGPYIEVAPGAGDIQYHFTGLAAQPVMQGDGIRVVLHTDRLAHLQLESPVYFRGIQVGAIQDIRFSGDATQVNITAFIWRRYARLLRPTSKFWSVSGTDIHGSVFSGIEVSVNNLKALVAGGVAFATPAEGPTQPAEDGTDFTLYPEADKNWIKWAAPIPLPPDDNPGQAIPSQGSDAESAKSPKLK